MNKHAFNYSVRLLQIKAYILTCTTIQAQNIYINSMVNSRKV